MEEGRGFWGLEDLERVNVTGGAGYHLADTISAF